MSTRRARIKAVTALPPRRKNVDAEVKKKIEEVEVPKTPKLRRVSLDKAVASGSPGSGRQASLHTKTTPDRQVIDRKVPTPIPTEKGRNTPSIDKDKLRNVFISPQARASPRRRSPIVKTPIIEVDLGTERLITAQGLQDIRPFVRNSSVLQRRTPVTILSDKESGNTTDEDTPRETSEVMDGIIPLQPVKVPPKPIDLLKNEIISENAEVSFDPIIPLPSPSKVRPKLRPVPRLGPIRRNSIQGSASESEDESRRALHGAGVATPLPPRQRHDSHTTHIAPHRDVNRVRNDSVCSSVSQSTAQTPAAIGSPLKEKNISKTRRQEVSRRMAAMRRRKESIKRDTLTMYDLIFYNPLTNPIIPDQEELKAKEANKKEQEERKEKQQDDEAPKNDAAPVPQIKLGPNGEIVLDEQSLVIKQSQDRNISSVVREGAWASGEGASGAYRRTPRTADWSPAETVRFYRAVAAIGTDFTLMQPLFPSRTRRDLKLKFKKEEKVNAAMIDKALRSGAEWDVTRLETEFNKERKVAEELAKNEKDRLRKELNAEKKRFQTMKDLKVKYSRGSKALETSILPAEKYSNNNLLSTADDLLQHVTHIKRKLRSKSKKTPLQERPQTKTPIPALIPLQPQLLSPTASGYATLTHKPRESSKKPIPEQPSPHLSIPKNIENGSLVVLAVDDPKSPTKKMFQTYISHEGGELTPISLPSMFLNSVVGYMKKGTALSPQLPTPSPKDWGISPSTRNTPVTVTSNSPLDLTPNRKRTNSCIITNL